MVSNDEKSHVCSLVLAANCEKDSGIFPVKLLWPKSAQISPVYSENRPSGRTPLKLFPYNMSDERRSRDSNADMEPFKFALPCRETCSRLDSCENVSGIGPSSLL